MTVYIPERDDMMGRGCFSLALYLHRQSGLQPVGLADDTGEIHHIFVAASDTGYDARGAFPVETAAVYRGSLCAGRTPVVVSPERLAEIVRKPGAAFYEDSELYRYCRDSRGLRDFLSRRRCPRPAPIVVNGRTLEEDAGAAPVDTAPAL